MADAKVETIPENDSAKCDNPTTLSEASEKSDKTKMENPRITVTSNSDSDSPNSTCTEDSKHSVVTPPKIQPSILGTAFSSASSSNKTLFGGSFLVCQPTLKRSLTTVSSSPTFESFSKKPSLLHKSLLRPSQLANPLGGALKSPLFKRTNPITLNPSKLNPLKMNPFSSIKDNDYNINNSDSTPVKKARKEDDSFNSKDNEADSTICQENDVTSSSAPNKQSASITLPVSTKSVTASSLFVPLSTPSSSTTTSNPAKLPPNTTPGGYVFGQNLFERAVVEMDTPEPGITSFINSNGSPAVSLKDSKKTSADNIGSTSTNGTSSEMLFSSVIQKELPEKNSSINVSTEEKDKKSLTESAREYEESRAVKRKYEEVTVVTGEEEEINVMQMDCKLFVYDATKLSYSVGIHGTLRVNDPTPSNKNTAQSRVIVRMAGTLRVLMNTKIWAGMTIEKPNSKIVRMTAMDTSGQIKVFLISSSPSESDMLFKILETRIRTQKQLRTMCSQNGCSSTNET